MIVVAHIGVFIYVSETSYIYIQIKQLHVVTTFCRYEIRPSTLPFVHLVNYNINSNRWIITANIIKRWWFISKSSSKNFE